MSDVRDVLEKILTFCKSVAIQYVVYLCPMNSTINNECKKKGVWPVGVYCVMFILYLSNEQYYYYCLYNEGYSECEACDVCGGGGAGVCMGYVVYAPNLI